MREGPLEVVTRALAGWPPGTPLVVGFSGGLDSSVLSEALVRVGAGPRTRLVHIDHGLHPDSHRWERHCEAFARQRELDFVSLPVSVPPAGNLEEAARDVRRQALLSQVPEGGLLLLAHHADDQAETLLLRLLRGAGVHGLAAMRETRQWQGRHLVRPLLGLSRAALEAQARAWGLSWVEDPSNRETDRDRNFLRHRVMPLLKQRWSAAPERLRGVTAQLEEAAGLLDERAREDFAACGGDGDSLALAELLSLSAARRSNLLHWWFRQRHMRAPGRPLLSRLVPDLLEAAGDRQPRLVWRDGVLARHAGRLYLLFPSEMDARADSLDWRPDQAGSVPFGGGWLGHGDGSCPGTYELKVRAGVDGFRVVTARGGERLLLNGMHRRLPELWREARVPPWRRGQLPLFYVGDELIAAAGAGVADAWRPGVAAPGRRIWWQPPGGGVPADP